jgi:excisionase family DNA binding protein
MIDEMYTTRQAAIYLGVTEADIRLAVRQGKLRAWSMPAQRGLLVRKSDLSLFRDGKGRSTLTRQLTLFTADTNGTAHAAESRDSDTSAA